MSGIKFNTFENVFLMTSKNVLTDNASRITKRSYIFTKPICLSLQIAYIWFNVQLLLCYRVFSDNFTDFLHMILLVKSTFCWGELTNSRNYHFFILKIDIKLIKYRATVNANWENYFYKSKYFLNNRNDSNN